MIKSFFKLVPDSIKQEFKIKLGAPHMFWSINNLQKNGLNAKQILDIGAYKGEWTKDILKIFPQAECLLIEGNPERGNDLKKFVSNNKKSKINFEIALLGSTSGEKKVFHVKETASSVLDEQNEVDSKKIILTTKTLDEITKKYSYNNISLVKLDVQGYELEILKGAPDVLQQAEAILMEVSLLDIHKNIPLMREVLNFMYEYNFVAYDICSTSSRRPMDRALWQTDLIFVKENSTYRSNKRYK